MDHLQMLPMQEGWIYEVILSTYTYGVPHAAPIGVWTEDFATLHMEIFDSSQTLQNVLRTKHFAVNFPPDVRTIHTVLFRPHHLRFEQAQAINAPLIRGSSGTVELTVSKEESLSDRAHITGTVLAVHVHQDIELINRAESLLLESLIVATRLPYLNNTTARNDLAENYRVIRKVAPNSSYEKTMAKLLRDTGLSS